MAKIFITGSADGLGQLSATALIAQGHSVVLHARNKERAAVAINKNPGAAAIFVADLSDINETIQLAEDVNTWGHFDAVIHNAGVYRATSKDVFAVNTLAPFILTALINKPGRIIYLSSGMHLHGEPKLESFYGNINQINYSDSKLHVLMLCKAVARKWPVVFTNTVNPGWVPTKMGGHGAPDDLQKGYQTQVWLAVSNDENAKASGQYFFHQRPDRYNLIADDVNLQDELLNVCGAVTGIEFPG